MKYILLLLGWCSLVYAGADEYNEKLDKIIDDCNKDPATRCSDSWLEAGQPPDTNLEGQGSHIFCRLKKVGSLTEEGDINKEAMKKDLSSGISDPEKVKTILEKCGTRKPGTSPEQCAIDNYRCVFRTFDELNHK